MGGLYTHLKGEAVFLSVFIKVSQQVVSGQVAPHLNRLINHLHGLAVGGLQMFEKRALAGSNIPLYIDLHVGGI